MSGEEEESPVVWSVTKTDDGKTNLVFGAQLSEAPVEDDAKLHLVGRALISLGTQLMGSTTRSDDDWDDDDDEWDS